MIELKKLTKTYSSSKGNVHALRDVSLNIEQGSIYGIIGFSGAGKSTLLRCINLLEKPDSGNVIVDGKDLTKLSSKDLRIARKNIGMIFQHFNLMNSKNIYNNIAYPLKNSGLAKNDIDIKVKELLNLVGLEDKAYNYPSQLSGGQKQRVAIARALANNPKVLLCDEATSALDPQTTSSILKLLKDINTKLNLTIVLITHEMHVVKDICTNVAVMDHGIIVENGDLIDVFSKPKTRVTKEFISALFKGDKIVELLSQYPLIEEVTDNELLVKISFIGQNTGQAFISKISRQFYVDANILFGNIEIIQNTPIGNLIVKLSGSFENILLSKSFLEENNIHVEVLENDKFNKYTTTQCS